MEHGNFKQLIRNVANFWLQNLFLISEIKRVFIIIAAESAGEAVRLLR